MRYTAAVIALLMVAIPCFAQGETWEETFDRDPEGWTVISGPDSWTTAEGRYIFPDFGWGRHMVMAPVEIVDGTITVSGGALGMSEAHGWGCFGVVVKYRDPGNFIALRFGAYGRVSIYKMEEGTRSFINIGELEAEVGQMYEVRLQVEGDQLRVWLEGEELEPTTIGWAGKAGRVGIYTETASAYDCVRIEGARPLQVAEAERIEGTPRPVVEFATFQPDPVAPGHAIPVAGLVHLYLRNEGDGPALLDRVEFNGRDANGLILDGMLDWWQQLPRRIEPGGLGRATVRVAALPDEAAQTLMRGERWQAAVKLEHLQAEPVETQVEIGPDTEPLRVNILTFGEDLRTVTAYLQAPDAPAGGFAITNVAANGRDLTGSSRFGARSVGETVVPVQITLPEPLTEGEDVTVTFATEQGVRAGHCLRAFPSEFPIQVCLFDQIREDYLQDIANHGFTTIAPNSGVQMEEVEALGMNLLSFGGGLEAIMRWWRPEYPRVIAFWLDERDERPVMETVRLLDQAHRYYEAEGRRIPRQMINLVGPWNSGGVSFMDFIDVASHGYGMAGASNGAEFPLLSGLPWRELRAARRPWWPYFRSAEVSVGINPETRQVLELAPNTQRVIEPAQERMLTYGCLQLGAKGILHWAYGVRGGEGESSVYYLDGPGLRLSMGGIPYPTTRTVRGYEVPEEICRALKDTFDEMGRINAELNTIGPWVANSDPSPLAQVTRCEPALGPAGGPAAQASALVSGLDTIILVALNLSIDADWSGREAEGIRAYPPVDAEVALDLPEWLEPAEIFSVDWRGIEDVAAQRDGRRLSFDLPGLEVQRLIVITSDPAVRAQMAERMAAEQERLRRMEAHQPVPIAE